MKVLNRPRLCRLVVACGVVASTLALDSTRAHAQSEETFGDTVYYRKSPGVRALVTDWTSETVTDRWTTKTPLAALADKELIVRGALNVLPGPQPHPDPRHSAPAPSNSTRRESVHRPAASNCGNEPAPGKKYGFAIEFEFGKSEIRPDGTRMLDDIGQALTEAPKVRMIIAGHTDSVGGPEYNCLLSKMRAEATKAYLVERFKIASDRLEVRWFGMSAPLRNLPESDGRNRRVDFQQIN